MKDSRNHFRWLVLALTLPLLAGGCSGPVAVEVKGQVKTSTGEPVSGGTLVFSPIGESGRKAASAEVQQGGTYAVTPGMASGQYRIVYSPPEQQLTEEQRHDPKFVAPKPLYMGMIPKTDKVEITVENSTVDIELVKKR
ncbi:hypothetical protein GC197_12415 [bacterium]|nr:hypothetical protein [bacterium]